MPAVASASPPTLRTCGKPVAGIDGCKAGWVMVRCDAEGHFGAPQVGKALGDLDLTEKMMVVIDIPIGLPNSGRRACDSEARHKLERRRNSVFLDVRRPLLCKSSYEEANDWGKQDGIGVSRQLWNIMDKIREVDEWISSKQNPTLREGHPELSFLAAARQPMSHHKRTAAGLAERLEALRDFVCPERSLELMEKTSHSGVAPDDILDALALCRSAARVVLRCHEQVPANPPKDNCGLAMEMVF